MHIRVGVYKTRCLSLMYAGVVVSIVGPREMFRLLLILLPCAVWGALYEHVAPRTPWNVVTVTSSVLRSSLSGAVDAAAPFLDFSDVAFGASNDEPTFFLQHIFRDDTPSAMKKCAFLCCLYTTMGVDTWGFLTPTFYTAELGEVSTNCSCLTGDLSPGTLRTLFDNDVHAAVATLDTSFTFPATWGVETSDCDSAGTLWVTPPWFGAPSVYWSSVDSPSLASAWGFFSNTTGRISSDTPPFAFAAISGLPVSPPGACMCRTGFVGHTCADSIPACPLGAVQTPFGMASSIGIQGVDVWVYAAGPQTGVTHWGATPALSSQWCATGGCINGAGGSRCHLESCTRSSRSVSWCAPGTCVPDTGACQCPNGRSSSDGCASCVPGFFFFGGECVSLRGNCIDPGALGFPDDPSGTQGSSAWSSGAVHIPECSGHGTCTSLGVVTSPQCVCDRGWIGAFCQFSPQSQTCGLSMTRMCKGVLSRGVVTAVAAPCERRLVSLPLPRDAGVHGAVEACHAYDGRLATSLELLDTSPIGWAMFEDVGRVASAGVVSTPLHVLYAHCMISPCVDTVDVPIGRPVVVFLPWEGRDFVLNSTVDARLAAVATKVCTDAGLFPSTREDVQRGAVAFRAATFGEETLWLPGHDGVWEKDVTTVTDYSLTTRVVVTVEEAWDDPERDTPGSVWETHFASFPGRREVAFYEDVPRTVTNIMIAGDGLLMPLDNTFQQWWMSVHDFVPSHSQASDIVSFRRVWTPCLSTITTRAEAVSERASVV